MTQKIGRQNPYAWIPKSLETITKAGWHRSPKLMTQSTGPESCIEEQWCLNFSSNDYLGLANDSRLKDAAIAAIHEYGTGSTGSRLVTGHRPLHAALEAQLAALKQTEDALVFSSGYSANIGTIAALVGKRDLILQDQYNHSSLRSGAALAGATSLDYAHCNLENLRQLLEVNRDRFLKGLIVTDSVFSMDGDLAPLRQILDLADEFQCMVLVDEAHGTGVLGRSGAGGIEACGCTGRSVIQMGTLSKAIGSLGGYVAGSAEVIDFLRNRAPSWIYTTALSPADTAAALAAVQIIQTEPDRRDRLWQNIHQFKQALQHNQIQILPSASAIIGLPLPSVQAALEVSRQLASAGIFAPAIRPPTVPTSRIRFTLMATHTTEQVQTACEAIVSILHS